MANGPANVSAELTSGHIQADGHGDAALHPGHKSGLLRRRLSPSAPRASRTPREEMDPRPHPASGDESFSSGRVSRALTAASLQAATTSTRTDPGAIAHGGALLLWGTRATRPALGALHTRFAPALGESSCSTYPPSPEGGQPGPSTVRRAPRHTLERSSSKRVGRPGPSLGRCSSEFAPTSGNRSLTMRFPTPQTARAARKMRARRSAAHHRDHGPPVEPQLSPGLACTADDKEARNIKCSSRCA